MSIWTRIFARKESQRSYDGAAGGRRMRNFPTQPSTIGAQFASRALLGSRARYLAANNALAASAVEAWVSALVGTGIKPQSPHYKPEIREGLNLAFEAWTDEADADQLVDFYALQALMVRRMIIDGECFALMVADGNALRIRLIDPEQVDPSLTRFLPNGGRIAAGIEFDAAGRRTAFHVLPERPGMPFASLPLAPTRIPAEDVIHLFKIDVPGQVRGVSWLAHVMLRLADLDTWRDAQLMRQKTAAMFVGFVTSPDGTAHPMQGEPDGLGNLVGGLEPGTLKIMNPGENIEFSSPATIGVEVIEFAKMTAREIAVGLGLPASVLTGDLSDVNYSSIRAGLVEWRRRIEAIQHGTIAFQALRRIWRRWAATEVLSGRLKASVDDVLPVKFITPKQQWVDPQKDVEAELAAIAGGLMSRREAVTSRGVDIEALDAEIAADQARADQLGLTFEKKPAAASTPAVPTEKPNVKTIQ